jgi:phosphoserine phosphatase RsbU/P
MHTVWCEKSLFCFEIRRVEHIKDSPSYKQLQREVNLKQLQINGLLAITQAINENVKANQLFTSYQKFLHLEMQVGTMALYFKEEDKWTCVAHYGFELSLEPTEIAQTLKNFKKRTPLAQQATDPFLGLFDLVIPVFHKEDALAYVFIGDLKEEDDILNNINFITTITNIITVAIENKRLFKEQAERQLLTREMDLAGQIQRSLIPARLPDSANVQFASVYKPHFAVGGDYYDVVVLPNDEIVFCIADISGKGISAALLMANFQAKLHALLLRGLDLAETICEMNAYVYQVTQGDRFITLFLAKYQSKQGVLEYVNAGHVPPVILLGDEAIKLSSGCTVLGFLPKLPSVQVGGLCLTDQEALLFSYTDGLTDVESMEGQYFDEDRLIDFLFSHVHEPIGTMTNLLLERVTLFKGNEAFPDDITVLACRLKTAAIGQSS